ncbi:ribosome biogenesis protein NOP53 [Copidosoma floridanum]|uniref:ribosome biogenesis protein NOP53 n=1 Tax=Copidosoma floridanum TaxID=29053 RepID=UPI0006C9CF58|nr:ribosome biogenesis protein NOP53 [Copidosoma floridanum]
MLAAGIKKRKVSKKTKKAWRKHVDVKDVDAFLEDQRLEERLGEPLSLKKDDDLFSYDREGDNKLEDYNYTTKQQRRELLRNAEPKCFAILKPHTAVPDPIAKRNRVRTPEERKNLLVKQKETLRKISGTLKLKEKEAIINRQLAQKKRAQRPKRGEFNTDAWEREPVIEPELKSEWLDKDTVRHTFANTRKLLKQVPKSVQQKPSIIPAINAPHPGISYNPSYADHQKLLRTVAADEIKLMKEEKHLERVTTQMFRKVTQREKEQDILEEMSQGLPFHKEENVSSDSEDDDPTVRSINPPVQNKKKTLVERRKIKERQRLEEERHKQKIEKKKIADIYHLNQIKKKLTKKQKRLEALKEKRLKTKARKVFEPKKLSRHKFEPLEQEFVIGAELTGNLRSAQPVGNLLKDRYKSLQQRNIVPPGTVALKRSKAKVKKFVKADHKIDLTKLSK